MKRSGTLGIFFLLIPIILLLLPGYLSADKYQFKTETAYSPASNIGFEYLYRIGRDYSTNDGELQSPIGVASDSSGNVYVTDTENHRVQVFDSSGNYLRQWGNEGSDPGEFKYMTGITVDTADNVYVLETSGRIQVFTSAGVFVRQFGSKGNGDGELNIPQDAAVDSAGNVYVADTSNFRVQVFSPDGTFLRKWGSYGTGNGEFDGPWGIALDSSENVYVLDTNNERVQVFDTNGTYLRQWGSAGTADGQMAFPLGIELDSADNVYVTEDGNNRVQKFTNLGVYITKWGSFGTGDGQFDAPEGIDVTAGGAVLVACRRTNRIQEFTTDGTFQRSFGMPSFQGGDLLKPVGIGLDNNDHLYVADNELDCVTKFMTDGTYVTHWDGTHNTGSGDVAFDWPQDVAADTNGNVFVTEPNANEVWVFDVNGNYTGNLDPGFWSYSVPVGVFVDQWGDIHVVDLDDGFVRQYQPDLSLINYWGSSDLIEPLFIATDAARNYYVTDMDDGGYGANAVFKFDNSLSLLDTWEDMGDPSGIAIDNDGLVYVVSRTYECVIVYDRNGNYLSEINFGHGSEPGEFNEPADITIGSDGRIYVSDPGNGRISVFRKLVGTGSIQVLVKPGRAVAAGAQWRLSHQAGWRDPGTTAYGVQPGSYKVVFKPVDGYKIPSAETITVYEGTRTDVTGTYVKKGEKPDDGTLVVRLKPNAARKGDAMWRIKGTDEWLKSGAKVTISAGTVKVEFKRVSGFKRPPAQTVTVEAGKRTRLTVKYEEK